jgi:hypothetical protein
MRLDTHGRPNSNATQSRAIATATRIQAFTVPEV